MATLKLGDNQHTKEGSSADLSSKTQDEAAAACHGCAVVDWGEEGVVGDVAHYARHHSVEPLAALCDLARTGLEAANAKDDCLECAKS